MTYQDGQTRVERRPRDDRRKYFPALGLSEEIGEDLGPYLNSAGQVKLPQRVIDDLGLGIREPVFFYKSDTGHWRLRTKEELVALMKISEKEAEGNGDRAG